MPPASRVSRLRPLFPLQTTTAMKKFQEELPGIVSERMAQLQREIINSRADDMLTWFCDAEIDDPDASTSVDQAPVDLGTQPCIGVASEGDPAVPLRRYSMEVLDVARTVALQVQFRLLSTPLTATLSFRTDDNEL